MHRYFLHLAYNGARYHGWQRQPNSTTVQETIEAVVSMILNEEVALTGCGRTDAGVHASRYVAHFDTTGVVPKDFARRLNRLLPPDIAIRRVEPMGPSPAEGIHGQHARFSAKHRAYRYDLIADKDPFRAETTWQYHAFAKLDLDVLNEAAQALLAYQEFAPFCKTNSDAKTMRCELRQSEWTRAEDGKTLHYYIGADRFLRGMVRLIVGACVQVSLGEMTITELRDAMIEQTPVPKPLSVPASGLFLTEVRYG